MYSGFVRCVDAEGVVVLEIILENLSHPHILLMKNQRPRKMK